MQGRKPKPTEVKRRAGNPGKRPLNDSEPQPERTAPERPAHFDEDAIEQWDALCITLEELGLLVKSDVAIMTLYCETWCEYVAVRKEVRKYGMVIVSPKTGSPFASPHLNIESGLKRQLSAYSTELGLTPSS